MSNSLGPQYITINQSNVYPLSEDVNSILGATAAGTLAANSVGAAADSDILNRAGADGRYVLQSRIGAANGVAGLDAAGKVPLAQLPDSLTGALIYQGNWDALNNTPALAGGIGTKGWFYKVGTAGNTVLDGNGDWQVGDWAVFDGTVWDKVDNSDAVTNVAGRTGAVTLAQADIAGLTTGDSPAFAGLTVDTLSGVVKATSGALAGGASTSDLPEGANLYYTDARAAAAAPVQSVAGRTGAVTLAVADVSGAAPLASPAFTGTPTAPTPAGGDNSTAIATTAFVASVSTVPTGAVIPFAGPAAPAGWLLCYGQTVSRTSYAALFTAFGNTDIYGGGDGSTTFGLPDLRGQAVFGKDDMGGSVAGRVTSGVSGINGESLGAFGGDQHMQTHSHSFSYRFGAGPGSTMPTGSDSGTTSVFGTNSFGAGSSQNMPPALILNYIIRT